MTQHNYMTIYNQEYNDLKGTITQLQSRIGSLRESLSWIIDEYEKTDGVYIDPQAIENGKDDLKNT